MAGYQRLSGEDAAFLWMESPTAHMHVGALMVFEDAGFTIDDVYEHIESRLHLVPKFRKKLMFTSLNVGLPVWVDDADFDIRYHVRHTAVAEPGDDNALWELTARLHSIPLDRSKPLWEIWIVDLPGDRKAVIQKTHHAMVDGISGVEIGTVLFDMTREGTQITSEVWTPEPAPSPGRLLAASAVERAIQPIELTRAAFAAARTPARLLREALSTGEGAVQFAVAGLERAPESSLNAPIGSHRRFEVARTRLDDVKAAKDAAGCTVNDIFLALIASTLRRLLTSRGERVEGLELHALVPVSVHTEDGGGDAGNKVSGLITPLPVGVDDPKQRLQIIHERMSALKGSNEALGAQRILEMGDYAPTMVMSLAARHLMGNPTGLNVETTNVPGPQFPLFFLGGEMLEVAPFINLTKTPNLGIAALSYNGRFDLGIVADWDANPDIGVVRAGLEEALTELLA